MATKRKKTKSTKTKASARKKSTAERSTAKPRKPAAAKSEKSLTASAIDLLRSWSPTRYSHR